MAEQNQPLFFKTPVPLQIDKHADAGLSQKINFSYSKPTNSVPINVQEFGLISKTYPIVFTGDAISAPVAILGLENSQNVFVSAKGEWEKGTYIPAYVRRYPFAFTGNEDQLILCVDESSDRYQAKAGKDADKFFNGNEQTDFTKAALQYCSEYQRDQAFTLAFAKALNEKGLLIDRQITANVEGREKPITLGGFKVIDEEKVNALDDKTVLEWYKNGFLALLSFQLLSMSNWQNILMRTA
jgi:hypothetical protein